MFSKWAELAKEPFNFHLYRRGCQKYRYTYIRFELGQPNPFTFSSWKLPKRIRLIFPKMLIVLVKLKPFWGLYYKWCLHQFCFIEQPFENGFLLRLWWHQCWTFVQWNLLGKPLCSNLSNLILYQCAAFCNQLNNHWNVLNTQWQTNTCLMSLLKTLPEAQRTQQLTL